MRFMSLKRRIIFLFSGHICITLLVMLMICQQSFAQQEDIDNQVIWMFESIQNQDVNRELLNEKNKGNTYFIDPVNGSDANDGKSFMYPYKTYATRKFFGGDKVLFKRGSVLRDMLYTCNGEKGAPITYGAYGEGNNPIFLGSVAVSNCMQWIEVHPSVWRYEGTLSSGVCNLIFNGGESCGKMRWNIKDLNQQGEWFYEGPLENDKGFDPKISYNRVLYLYSQINPGLAYKDIECVQWGHRKLVGGQAHIILENLSFRNSGVHGYQESYAHNITIRHCEFRFIGGAIWDREKRIRFGNAIEFWKGAHDITVEHCLFDNIYDSGVTHQGGGIIDIPERLYFRYNYFANCGMAAYECREPSQEVYFEFNKCINAGGGFSMQGETPPRQSEIYPQPIGHHVFIWRIDAGTQSGYVYIRNNTFSEAPYGTMIYSMISPVDEQKFVIDHNSFWQTTGDYLIYFSGRFYTPLEFKNYKVDCNQDMHSNIKKSK